MQLVLTTAGLAAINSASGPVTVVGYKLGSAVAYTPTSSDTDIHGSLVFSGVPSSPEIVQPSTYRYTIQLDASVGPFNFGEVALFLPGNILFALGSFATQQSKVATDNNVPGQPLYLNMYVTVSGNNAIVFLDALNANTTGVLPIAVSVDDLPQPAATVQNLYSVIDPLDVNTMRLATTTGSVWTVTGYDRPNISGVVTAVTPYSVSVTLNQSYVNVTHNESFLQFFSGPLMGVCRVIYDAATSGTDAVFSLNTVLSQLPSIGDSVQVFSRVTSYTTEVPAQTRSLLAGLNPTLSAADLNQMDSVDVANLITKQGTVAFTADQSLGGHRMTNSAAPQADTDLATKSYVDALASGRAPKANVKVASTSNINLSSPGASIDGVSLSNGDSFLAKDQTLPAQNGIYVWNGASSTATRRADFDSPTNILPGSYFFADLGNTNAAHQFILSTATTVVVGTTPLTFITVNTASIPADVVRAGGSVAFTADQSMGGHKLISVATPTQSGDAATKGYTDSNFLRTDGTNSPTANINFGGVTATNVGTPVNNGDIANKVYSDLKGQGINLSADVRVASSANLTLSSMPSAVDGVTLTSGDAFLARSQSTASQNGVYTFNGASSPATRRADFTSTGQLLPGFAVKVLQGTSIGMIFVNTTALPATMGSTAITFTQYSSSMNYLADVKSDGSKAFVADQSMGGHRLTNLATPSASTDAVNKGYLDGGFVKLDGSTTLTGPLNAGGHVYQNEGTPINSTDGANKLYVDLARQGLTQYADVRVASLSNIVLAAPGANIDSIALTAGDTFLAKDQTSALENGLYTFNGASSPCTRRADFASSGQMIRGASVKVLSGTEAGNVWVHTTSTAPIVVGSTSLTFQAYSSSIDVTGYVKADGTVPMTADLNMNSHKVTGVSTPTLPTDIANKAYVDQATGNPSTDINANGYRITNLATPNTSTDGATKLYADLKAQGINLSVDVKVATTANINLSSMPSSVDSISLTAGDAVLVKNQTSASQNGVYTFSGVGVAAVRRSDFDTSGEALLGFAVRVLQGTASSQVWVHTTAGTVILGSTSLTFTQYSGSMNYTGYLKADGSVASIANQSMGGFRITSLGTPSATDDASTKGYTDTVDGNSPWKDVVRVASTTSINLSAPGNVLDGVVMVSGDSFLAKDQSTGSQNGIYIWNGASSPATRRTDASASTNLKPGMVVMVSEGLANAGRPYRLSTPAPITVGATSLTYVSLIPATSTGILPDGSVPFAANQSMGGFRLTTMGTPAAGTDGANKSYVDSGDQAVTAKDSVRVASTANVNLSAPGASIDGVSLSNGDAFLAKDQSTASQNGIYVFNGAASPATRRSDFNSSTNVKPGSTVYVHSGSTNAGKYYLLTTPSPITVDSTSLAFNLVNPNTGNIRSDGAVPFGANQSMAGNLITNLGTAYSSTDAANRQYVDYKEAGITFLLPVRLASTANISVSAPGSSMDGVSFVTSDFFLLKNQTAAAENGLYVWNGASTPATRRSDFNASGMAKRGLAVVVQAGNTQANQILVHSTPITNVVLGTTPLNFLQYAAGQDYSLLSRIYWDNNVSGTYTIDTSQYEEFQLTLTGPTTLVFSNPLPGRRILLKLKQDATGSRAVTLPVSVRYSASIPSYTPTATANGIDRIGLYYDGVDAKWDLLAMAKAIS